MFNGKINFRKNVFFHSLTVLGLAGSDKFVWTVIPMYISIHPFVTMITSWPWKFTKQCTKLPSRFPDHSNWKGKHLKASEAVSRKDWQGDVFIMTGDVLASFVARTAANMILRGISSVIAYSVQHNVVRTSRTLFALYLCNIYYWQLYLINGYSISQEICTRFLLCCALLWLYIDWFSHIHQAYFTGTVAI